MHGLPGPTALIAALAFLVLAQPVTAGPTDPGPLPARRVVLDEGFDRPGGDLQQVFNTTREACVAICLGDAACGALTYNAGSRACFPKGGDAGAPMPFAGAQSGLVVATDPARMAGARDKAGAAAGWLSAADTRAARAQAADIGATWPGTGADVAALRQMATDAAPAGGEAVIRWIGAATAQSDDPSDWLSLSQWLTSGDDGASRTDAAMSAAINSWLRDPGAGTLALRRWAELAQTQDRGRDGLNALRLAATRDADPDLATMLAGFEARHGLRIEDTQVDADAPAPRACLRMSDALAPGTDYRSFVALSDPALSVEAEDHQLCVTGITHGQRLALTLRKGLPAADGEVLARDVPVNLYVRDRTPQARFAGRAYVLPAGGDQGLTVRTVNTDRVALALYRMSDRNIVRALRQGIFGQPLDDWRADSFTDELGQQVWQGEADTAPAEGGAPVPVNTEVATRVDIARAAGPLAPGVYALTAGVPGQDADRSPPATQWFMISNLGMASYGGTDGLTVVVRGLDDAAPVAGATVQLVSRANAVLGSALTDAEGIARFAPGLSRGQDSAAPAMVTASTGAGDAVTDMAFLSLTEPEFDLSDRGVEGAPPAPPIDIFATTDRGAYRAGETLHATILARDAAVAALDGLPLTATLTRPDGVEALRMLVPSAGDGGHVLDWPIPASAPRGSWRLDLRVEEDGPPLATLRVLVEDFRPERLDLTPDVPPAPLAATRPLSVGLTARWLYGAPGADLPVEAELRLAPSTEIPGWAGYVFGRHDAPDDRTTVPLDPGQTDAAGRWQAELPIPPALAAARHPVEATFALSVREGAGRPVERREVRLVMPQSPVIGIKPGFQGGSTPEGSEAAFQVVALGPDMRPVAAEASWVLNRIDTDYQWYALEGDWQWEPVTTRSRAASGQVRLANAPAPLALLVEWGEYELVVTAADGAQGAVRFTAGWGAADTGTDTPDRMTVTLDKPAYRAGDTARLTMDAAAGGTALVSVLSNRVVSLQVVPVKAGTNSLDLPVTDDWGAGVYVAVSAIRPLDGAGTQASHAPVRTLGLAHAAVDPGARRLQASLTAPSEVRPRTEARLRLNVAGAVPGETVHATISAVDQGILNLTGFKSPDPLGHYFGQRRLGVALRDLYGRLLLASGAADGAIRSGGDADADRLDAPPPTEKLMAWFSGPVTVGPDGTAEVAVPLPDFNGAVKAMAVVWTRSAIGQAEASLLVRDPVVMTVTAPAFLAPGDTAEVRLALTHVAGPAGTIGLDAQTAGGPTLGLGGLPPAVTLADKGRGEAVLTLTAPQTEGTAQLRLTARLPNGEALTKDLSIPIENQEAAVTRSTRLTLAPGESATFDPASLGTFRPGTGTATLTAGAWAQLDVGAAVLRLASYPYGCTEQIASGAMPQLYLSGLLPGITLPGASDAPRDIDQAIAAILTRQTSSGAFGLWRAEPGDAWLDAYATDFLSRARAAGHAVPDEAFRRALENLQNTLNAASEPQYADPSENAALAYAAYVLARNRAAVVSDLRYYADTAGDSFATPMAAAQLGAALAAYGDVGRADAMFGRAQAMLMRADGDKAGGVRGDYGTALRDAAAALALATDAGSAALDRPAAAQAIAAMVAARQAQGADLSTQEALWVVLAGHALQAAGAPGLTIGDAPAAGALTPLGDPAGLSPLRLVNTGAAPLPVTISVTAAPVDPPPAGGTAWSITRSYFTPEGAPADPAQLAQGTRLVAVLTVTPLAEGGGRLIITDPLPAGFEIDNPNLITAGEADALPWLDNLTEAQMAEFRQDRFAAAVTWTDSAPFTLAYRLRAVTLGEFRHPAATVEDMYRPERRGWTDSGRTRITR